MGEIVIFLAFVFFAISIILVYAQQILQANGMLTIHKKSIDTVRSKTLDKVLLKKLSDL
jgi:hypothetical protein